MSSNIFYTLVFDKGSRIIYEVDDTPIAKKWLDAITATFNSKFKCYPTGWWAHPDYDEDLFLKTWDNMYEDVCMWNRSELTELKPIKQQDDPNYKKGDYVKWKFYGHKFNRVPWQRPEKFFIDMPKKCPAHKTNKSKEKLQDTLNRLHERFHEITEEMEAYVRPNRVLLEDSPLQRLNIDIHTLEHMIKNKKGNPDWTLSTNCAFYLTGPTKWDKHLVPITEEEYKQFNYASDHGDMILGYHTVGKNLHHCWKDNDIELIKRGLVRPQKYIATEVICIFYGGTSPNNTGNMDNENKKMWDWVIENNLQEYVDMNDPAHSANYPPRVASLLNDVSMEEIATIYANEKIKHIELVDQNTMLKWKSDDYRV